jgi:predicted MFS family arabinose efflux permease
MVTSPVVGLLAAIVQAQDGSIIDLGVFATATSVGGFVGAGFAGARAAGENPTRYYAYAGITAAVALALFALLPLGIASLLPLAIIGWVLFSQAVWNTSRIRQIAGPAYQARLQAITSMAFTLGFSLGLLWAGAAIDRLGLVALLGGALMLAVLGVIVVALPRRTPSELALKPDEPSE